MSLDIPRPSPRMWITYVHTAETSPADPPLKPIFSVDT